MDRLKIQVQVADKTCDINLTLFGEDATKVINTTTEELMQVLAKDNSTEILQEIVKKSLGKNYSFTFKITEKNIRFALQNNFTTSKVQEECGRAGHDGQRSSCVLYYSYSDYIRVKKMISLRESEQDKCELVSCTTSILETNMESLLRMVSYCENNVDCRRLLQLVHFGEKFDTTNCRSTCDNCSRMLMWSEKYVTDIAKQLIELVKKTGQRHSSTHILEIYKGSMSQVVKKHGHHSLSLHGAGKYLDKVMSSQVKRAKADDLFSGQCQIILRFPVSEAATKKKSKSKVTRLEDLWSPKNLNDSDSEVKGQSQNGADLDISNKLYAALRALRKELMEEAGEGVSSHHLFGNAILKQISKKIPRTKKELQKINGISKAKIRKYGDQLLETIEHTIEEFKWQEIILETGNGSEERYKSLKKRGSLTDVALSGTKQNHTENSLL